MRDHAVQRSRAALRGTHRGVLAGRVLILLDYSLCRCSRNQIQRCRCARNSCKPLRASPVGSTIMVASERYSSFLSRRIDQFWHRSATQPERGVVTPDHDHDARRATGHGATLSSSIRVLPHTASARRFLHQGPPCSRRPEGGEVFRHLLRIPVVLCRDIVLDRINIGFAGLTMMKDLGLTSAEFGFRRAVLPAYVAVRVPSDIALARIGARRWIGTIMIAWGLASTATMFATSAQSLLLLGACSSASPRPASCPACCCT